MNTVCRPNLEHREARLDEEGPERVRGARPRKTERGLELGREPVVLAHDGADATERGRGVADRPLGSLAVELQQIDGQSRLALALEGDVVKARRGGRDASVVPEDVAAARVDAPVVAACSRGGWARCMASNRSETTSRCRSRWWCMPLKGT